MFASCVASAYAIDPSERTFAAIAALIGIARFAFTSDIAARSGSSSPAISLSSSGVSFRYSSDMRSSSSLGRLRDVSGLLSVRVRDRVVARDVQRGGEVDRRGYVRVDQRHRGPLRQLLARKGVELLARQCLVFLRLAHG